jgi:3-oxoacyl-[acyl-carrier protein] reductase
MNGMDDLLGLRDRVALVIGAGRSIARSTALLLARAGCHVALVDIDAGMAKERAGEVRALGRESLDIQADVTRPEQAEHAVAQAALALGRIDVVANIVGGASWAPLLELDAAAWEADLRSNLLHHFHVARAAARRMIAQGSGGSIVGVSSVSGLFSAPRHAAYGAAKAGLVALVKTMAEEWGEHGIRVNAVAPGGVRTESFDRLVGEGTTRPSDRTFARLCEPDDIGGAILLLSSKLARRVTGQTLAVDGGSSTANPFGLS